MLCTLDYGIHPVSRPFGASLRLFKNRSRRFLSRFRGNDKKRMSKYYCVYILANRRSGALYIGVTSDLPTRIWQHKNKQVLGFTARYGVDKLVYYETCDSAESAIQREKQMKKWNREWKMQLIEEENPEWRDLYKEII